MYRIQNPTKKLIALREWQGKNRQKTRESAFDFYHRNRERVNELRRNNPYSLMSILKRNAKKRGLIFDIAKGQFIEWWNLQEKKCVYCDIPVDRLSVTDKAKKLSKRLSIDRIDNSLGYSIPNIVLACLRCNFIKSNLFSFDEMKEIGQKYIKPRWQL